MLHGDLLVDLSSKTKASYRIRYGLVPALDQLAAETGRHITILVPAGSSKDLGAQGVALKEMPPWSDLALDELVLPRMVRHYRVAYTMRECIRLPKNRAYKVVVHSHEHFQTRFSPIQSPRQALREAQQRGRASLAYERCDHLAFSSQWTQTVFERLHAPERLPPRSVVHLGGWPDHASGASHGTSTTAPYIVVIASDDPRDEVAFALQTWDKVGLGSPWELHVVGKVAAPVVTAPGVRWLGWLSDADLYDELASAAAYLHIGSVEGFGMSVIEALQTGTPVVARVGSAVDELLANGGGILVKDVQETTEAIATVVSGSPGRSAALTAGRAFTWANTAKQIVGITDAL